MDHGFLLSADTFHCQGPYVRCVWACFSCRWQQQGLISIEAWLCGNREEFVWFGAAGIGRRAMEVVVIDGNKVVKMGVVGAPCLQSF